MASSKGGDSDGGSLTPSESSDRDERSDRDSDYETDEDDSARSKNTLNLQWTGYGKKTPVLLFRAEYVLSKKGSIRTVGERYHMAYKFGNSECKIVRQILNTHGFHEVHPNSSDYNMVWTGAHLKPFTLRGLTEFQKINHFPRSYELTRKDRLFKNVQRMQQIKGAKNFDIVPSSFVLPGEYQEFCSAFLKDKGPWIVKPVASSRGRGVFLVNHPDQIPLDENVIVGKYLAHPLLIDGFKFDVRLYVAVTSYDPLMIYLYEEGLTRFATVKYEKSGRHIRNQCMHLTNYSVNKKNDDYVKNDDADVEDYGNKWSLGAMLRYLRSSGKDTAALMMKIEDCLIKTILSVELPIATACKMFMPFRGNCYELYGFDILIDDQLKPWVLEVNLSPSLACDSPLDLKIKGNMLCDLFSLTGLICHDPMMRTMQQSRRNIEIASKMAARAKSARIRSAPLSVKQRPQSAGSMKKGADTNSNSSQNKNLSGLNSDEIKIVRRAREEDNRKGGWVKIFPTADSWDLYSSFLQFSTTNNLMLHQKLYPERHKGTSTAVVPRGSSAVGSSAGTRAKGYPSPKLTLSAYIQLSNNSIKPTLELAAAYAQAILRTKQYERKLGTNRPGRRRNKRRAREKSEKDRRKLVQGVADESGEENEDGENEGEDEDIGDDKLDEDKVRQKEIPPAQLLNRKTEEVIQIVVEKDGTRTETGSRLSDKSGSVDTPDGVSSVVKQKETVVEVKPPPPPAQPPEPKYNVVDLLQNGRTLSKVQARTAFAMYLVRVQQRLMADVHSMTDDDVDGLNEQMDLVLRFLKRAAVNLQQQFKVVVPSRKLPLNDRRRILAKQLGDFVHIYNKDFLRLKRLSETEQLRSKKQLDKRNPSHLRRAESVEGLNEDKFERFIHTASESELEEVLTTYTKINKSASIFLGGKTSTTETQHVPTTGNSMKHIGATVGSRPSSSKPRDNTTENTETPPTKTVTGWEDVPRAIHSIPTSSADLRPNPQSSNSAPPSRTGAAMYSTASAASYASAVQIYTQKLTSLRPRSASLTGQKTGQTTVPVEKTVVRSRPSSAVLQRATGHYGSSHDLQDPYNEKVISDALQRLTLRQQARQYSAFNGTSILPDSQPNSRPSSASGPRVVSGDQAKTWAPYDSYPNQNGGSIHVHNNGLENGQGEGTIPSSSVMGRQMSMEEHISKKRPPPGAPSNQKRAQSADHRTMSRKPVQTNVNLQNANATFNSFIEDTGTNWQNDLALAYNQVTGVLPQNYHTPSQSSKQYQILQQQALKQQSKALLEQSKAKHQAMVAQAYAVQKSLQGQDERQDSEPTAAMYAPKPPVKPSNRKAASAHHRTQRRATTEDSSLSFNFYTSSKSAVNGAR